MAKANTKTLRKCDKGHSYFKSSDCPVCPICEKEKNVDGFLSVLSAPAQRALEKAGINTLKKLATYSENQILSLHGMGKSSIPKLVDALSREGLQFKQ